MSEPADRPKRYERLTDKLPEILIEAGSVVIALLLGLALNSWNENREIRQRADAARAAIIAELGENRHEIDEARPKLKDIVEKLTAAAADDAPASHELNINLGLSLLSAAAWRAALATQASQTIDFAWMTRVAKVYELQENYIRVQGTALDQISSIPADKGLSGKQVAQSLIARMSALSQLADGLSRSYDDVLGEKHP